MPKKRMGTVQGLRTAQKTRLRSKPRAPGQEFLDLYILKKLCERYERERKRAAEDLKYTLADMVEIAKDVEEVWAADKAALEKMRERQLSEALKEPEAQTKRAPKKPLKAVPFDY